MKIQAHPDAKLSHTQLEELAERLASKRHDLLDAQTTLNQQIAAKDDSAISDAAEAASLQEVRARASGVADQNQWIIAEIEGPLSARSGHSHSLSNVNIMCNVCCRKFFKLVCKKCDSIQNHNLCSSQLLIDFVYFS